QEYYCRVIPESIFAVPRPGEKPGVGFDAIPQWIVDSGLFTPNELARLAGIAYLPADEDVMGFSSEPDIVAASQGGTAAIAALALRYLRSGSIEMAWKVILAGQM